MYLGSILREEKVIFCFFQAKLNNDYDLVDPFNPLCESKSLGPRYNTSVQLRTAFSVRNFE